MIQAYATTSTTSAAQEIARIKPAATRTQSDSLLVYVFSMSHTNDLDDQNAADYRVDHAVVTDANTIDVLATRQPSVSIRQWIFRQRLDCLDDSGNLIGPDLPKILLRRFTPRDRVGGNRASIPPKTPRA